MPTIESVTNFLTIPAAPAASPLVVVIVNMSSERHVPPSRPSPMVIPTKPPARSGKVQRINVTPTPLVQPKKGKR